MSQVRTNRTARCFFIVLLVTALALFGFAVCVISSIEPSPRRLEARMLVSISLTDDQENSLQGTQQEQRQLAQSDEGGKEDTVSLSTSNTSISISPVAVAYDQQGNTGYIHDPYYVKNHPLGFTHHVDDNDICKEPLGMGQEGPHGIRAFRKIKIMMNATEESQPQEGEATTAAQSPTRILCMVYSYSGRHDVIRSVAETYGSRCDGFMAASNMTEPEIGAVHLEHAGHEQYGNMWQKVRSMWQYAHDNYLDDFEFFHIGGDDMYVIAENLRYAASLEDPSKPVYMGAAMVDRLMPRKRYCGGGAGYTLSREAVRRMVEEEFESIRCNPSTTRPDEDRLMGTCLRLRVAKCTHNMDELEETRYHHYDAEFHARWDRRKAVNWDWRHLLKWHKIIAYKERLEGISETSTTFHLISNSIYRDRGLRRYHALLYGLCGEKLKLEPLPKVAAPSR